MKRKYGRNRSLFIDGIEFSKIFQMFDSLN